MAAAELPLLDATVCTGCGDCVAVCPVDCLAMDGPLPWLPRPGRCISCTLCVLICPAGALRMDADDEAGWDEAGERGASAPVT